MLDPDFVTVRRPAGATFSVLPADLVSDTPASGYDLTLMRSLRDDGLVTPITVRAMADGRFEVVDGRKRVAAIQMLVRINKLAFDNLRGLARPATRVFAMIRCRIRPRPASARPGREGPPARCGGHKHHERRDGM